MSAAGNDSTFLTAFHGSFAGLLRFEQFEALCERIGADEGWYLYALANPPPAHPLSPAALQLTLADLIERLRPHATEGRCGFVYVDDLAQPAFIKIYDPAKFAACGMRRTKPRPGWVLSKLKPESVPEPKEPVSRWRRFRLF